MAVTFIRPSCFVPNRKKAIRYSLTNKPGLGAEAAAAAPELLGIVAKILINPQFAWF